MSNERLVAWASNEAICLLVLAWLVILVLSLFYLQLVYQLSLSPSIDGRREHENDSNLHSPHPFPLLPFLDQSAKANTIPPVAASNETRRTENQYPSAAEETRHVVNGENHTLVRTAARNSCTELCTNVMSAQITRHVDVALPVVSSSRDLLLGNSRAVTSKTDDGTGKKGESKMVKKGDDTLVHARAKCGSGGGGMRGVEIAARVAAEDVERFVARRAMAARISSTASTSVGEKTRGSKDSRRRGGGGEIGRAHV